MYCALQVENVFGQLIAVVELEGCLQLSNDVRTFSSIDCYIVNYSLLGLLSSQESPTLGYVLFDSISFLQKPLF